VLKQVWITIVVIATVGVVITAAITAAAAYGSSAFRSPCGALGAANRLDRSGDAGAVFRQVRIRDRSSP